MHAFSFKKIHLKISSGKWEPFCLGLNVLKNKVIGIHKIGSIPILPHQFNENCCFWCGKIYFVSKNKMINRNSSLCHSLNQWWLSSPTRMRHKPNTINFTYVYISKTNYAQLSHANDCCRGLLSMRHLRLIRNKNINVIELRVSIEAPLMFIDKMIYFNKLSPREFRFLWRTPVLLNR